MTASSYNVCIYTQPKPLILCGNVFEGRVLKQSESYKLLVSPLQPLVYKGSCEHHYGVGIAVNMLHRNAPIQQMVLGLEA